MKIQMDHEHQKLQKEIKVHHNDITKSHVLGSRMAQKIGTTRDEIRRNKGKSKMTMRVIRQSKSAVPGSRRRPPVQERAPREMTGTNYSRRSGVSQPEPPHPIKQKLGRVTQFNISGTGFKNQPINITTDMSVTSQSFSRPRTAKSSWAPKDPLSRIQSLTDIYNDNLDEVVMFD